MGTTSAQQEEALRAGELDVGFVRSPLDDRLESVTLHWEPLLVALPPGHPLAGRPQLSVQALRDEEFILFPRHLGPGFYDQLIGLCQRADFRPRVVQEAVQMKTTVSHVADGLGVAFVPASVSKWLGTSVTFLPL